MNDRVLALAGIFQAAGMVQQVARRGSVDAVSFDASIRSIFEVSPETTEAVFRGAEHLAMGLKLIVKELASKAPTQNKEILKYVFTILVLERQLDRRPELLKAISAGVENARFQSGHFSKTHENVIANLASCYRETISTLTPRVMVRGEHGLLENPLVANKVRALLLAAIRSAVLWQQLGGSRFQLIFRRRKIVLAAEQILRKIEAHTRTQSD